MIPCIKIEGTDNYIHLILRVEVMQKLPTLPTLCITEKHQCFLRIYKSYCLKFCSCSAFLSLSKSDYFQRFTMAGNVAWEEEICTSEKQIIVIKDDVADKTNTNEGDKKQEKGLCSCGFKITVEPILLLFGVANYPLNPLTQQVK